MVRRQQMDYVNRHSDKEHNCVSLFVLGWVHLLPPALSVPLVLTCPDLGFYPILFDPLPPYGVPPSFSLSKFFTSFLCHPSITASYFSVLPHYTSSALPSLQTPPSRLPLPILFLFFWTLVLLLQSPFIATLSLPVNPLLLLCPYSLSDSPGKTC